MQFHWGLIGLINLCVCLSASRVQYQPTQLTSCAGWDHARCLNSCVCGWCIRNTSGDLVEFCLTWAQRDRCEGSQDYFETIHNDGLCEEFNDVVGIGAIILISILGFVFLSSIIAGVTWYLVYSCKHAQSVVNV